MQSIVEALADAFGVITAAIVNGAVVFAWVVLAVAAVAAAFHDRGLVGHPLPTLCVR